MLNPHRHPKLTVFGIILLFISPMWLAGWLYHHHRTFTTQTTNHGQLITPPISSHNLSYRDASGISHPLTEQTSRSWTLLFITPSPTVQMLYTLRQIRLMLGKNSHQLQPMLLFYDKIQAKLPFDPNIRLGKINKLQWDKLLKARYSDGFFMLDPAGRLMMYYPTPTNPRHIMQDLQRLMTR